MQVMKNDYFCDGCLQVDTSQPENYLNINDYSRIEYNGIMIDRYAVVIWRVMTFLIRSSMTLSYACMHSQKNKNLPLIIADPSVNNFPLDE